MTHPKIELHVHLEGTVRPALLFAIARRNRVGLPVATPEGLAELYRFRGFEHFLEVWWLTVTALRHERDFRVVVVAYAAEAVREGPRGTRSSAATATARGRPRSDMASACA